MHAVGLALSPQRLFQSSVFVHAVMIGMRLWHSCIPVLDQVIHHYRKFYTHYPHIVLFDLNPSLLFLF